MMRNVGRAQRVSSAPTPALLVNGEAQHVSGPRALLSLSRHQLGRTAQKLASHQLMCIRSL